MAKPNVIRNAPSLLHAVALVGPNHAETVRNIRNMERGAPPALYKASTQIVVATIKRIAGGTSNKEAFDWAKGQAKALQKAKVRDCAIEVLAFLKPFLLNIKPKWFRPIDVEYFQAGADLQIPVKVTGLLRLEDKAVILAVNFWKKPLETEQLRAAISILKDRIELREELQGADLHFLDISVPLGKKQREYRNLSWSQISPLSDADLQVFANRLCRAWLECQANPEPKKPSKPKRSDQADMFSDHSNNPRG